MKPRLLLLLLLLAVTGYLALAAPESDAEATLVAEAEIVRVPQYRQHAVLAAVLLPKRTLGSSTLFQLPSPPAPSPPPTIAPLALPVVTPPPPPPQPPTLPFRFLGRIQDESGVRVFLQHGEDLFYASEGQKLSLDYQVVEISARRVTFLYLPLNLQQELTIHEQVP